MSKLVMVLFVVLVIIAGVFLLSNRRSRDLTFSSNEVGRTVNNIYQSVDGDYMFKRIDENEAGMLWVSEDGWKIVSEAEGFKIAFLYNDVPKSGKGNSSHPEVQVVNTVVSDELRDSGFSFHELSSTMCAEDIDCNLAFKKGDNEIICSVSTANDGFYKEDNLEVFYTYVACSDKFQENYGEQSPYLKALGDHELLIRDLNSVGDLIYLSLSGGRSGFELIGRYINNEILKIWEGQGSIPCDVINENDFPETLYPGECLEF